MAMIVENLTPREQEIFNLLLEGMTPKEISYKLNIVHSTVDYHRQKIYRKLDVHTINELLTKYNAQPMDTTNKDALIEHTITVEKITVEPHQSQNFIQKNWKNEYRIKRAALFISFVLIISIAIIIIGNFIFGTSTFIKYDSSMLIISNNAEWHADINSFDEAAGIGSLAVLNIGKETIQRRQRDVLILTAYLSDRPDWKNANFVTAHPYILQMLREGSGIRFKVLGDGEPGWRISFWTILGDNITYEYPIFTIKDQIVEIDIPFPNLMQPSYQTVIPLDMNNVTHMAIMRNAPCCCLYGLSVIKIFDFKIY